MKIFIDTAKLNEIREAISWGIVDGVTTNPSLVRKAIEEEKRMKNDVNMEDYIGEICKAAGRKRPVSLEVMSHSAEKICESCGMPNKVNNKFCKSCGAELHN